MCRVKIVGIIPARDCARVLASVALRKEIEMNWDEVLRACMKNVGDDVRSLIPFH
jgi:hypothetical protein